MKQPFVAIGACVALVYLIPQLSSVGANEVSALLGYLDPDGAFLWSTAHHSFQLVLTLVAAFVFGIDLRTLGFNLEHEQDSIALVKAFTVYYVAFIVAGHVVLFWVLPAPQWVVPMTASNISGELAFKALLSGTAEEPLFRGLVMTLLYGGLPGSRRYLGIDLSHAGAIATVLFTLAHIGLDPFSLQVTWISPVQLVQAFVLGVFYAFVFDRTRSLLAPILAHNFANFFLTAVGMIWSLSA